MAATSTTSASEPASAPSAAPQTSEALIANMGLDRAQLLALIANLPQANFGPKPGEAPPPGFLQHFHADPGPSSHPRGPPPMSQHDNEVEEGSDGDSPPPSQSDKMPPVTPSQTLGGRRSRNGAAMGSDEWTRQRKDNHKEVERRRRGNINEGINELGRIVPNGSGEKAKGAILSRAVQYIHHLKENEARNIEKWTLEKLLMDQAMGDLQAQLEEMRRLWEEERVARMRLDTELDALRKGSNNKRPLDEGDDSQDDDPKRQRTE